MVALVIEFVVVYVLTAKGICDERFGVRLGAHALFQRLAGTIHPSEPSNNPVKWKIWGSI